MPSDPDVRDSPHACPAANRFLFDTEQTPGIRRTKEQFRVHRLIIAPYTECGQAA